MIQQMAIAGDIEYAAENLGLIRDDSGYNLDGTDINAINGVLDEYGLARTELLANHVKDAIAPETRAYRTLRRLVDDIVQGDLKGGNAANKDKPDKVELKDVQHLTRLERARVASQLKMLKQRLAEVAKEQETLNRTFLHFLRRPQKHKKRAKVNDEKSWLTDASPSNQAGRQNQQRSAGPNPKQDRTVEGALEPASGAKIGSLPANFAEIMKVLKAQQKQLRTELSMLEEQLAQIPIGLNEDSNKSGPIGARKEAKAHIGQAKNAMDRFEAFLAEQYYEQHDSNQLALEAQAMLAAISRELMMARQSMQQEVASYTDNNAERLRQMALNLQEMANAYDNALTPEQQMQLLNSMAAATAQLNSISSAPPDNTNVGGDRSGRATGPALVVKSDYQGIVDAARFTARHFLSKGIEVTRRTGTRVGSADGGSLKFYEQENDFFESAAESRSK
jgi:hypothetical protein